MKKILAIGGSNSSKSINKALANYTALQLTDCATITADLNDLALPLYNPELEQEIGIPDNTTRFYNLISEADGIVLSLAEHNGLITAAFKNLWDWTSRINKNIWQNKPMFLMATSPGRRGAANALSVVQSLIPHYGGNVIASFSLPSFHRNFSNIGITDTALKTAFEQQLNAFQSSFKTIQDANQ